MSSWTWQRRTRKWLEWSAEALADCGEANVLVINPLIYAEVSVGFERIEDLDDVLPAEYFRREPLPWTAAFLAGKVFRQYRHAGGTRRCPLPDFYIGAHAAVLGYTLLTRDARRYRSYFRGVTLISP